MTDAPQPELLELALARVYEALIVPAAEYVPAIRDAWTIIDDVLPKERRMAVLQAGYQTDPKWAASLRARASIARQEKT